MVWQQSHQSQPQKNSPSFLSSKTPKKAYFVGGLVESSSTEKLLRIQIDSDLTFDEHISSICNKVAKRLTYSTALLIIFHLISAV